jgi:hypothetical protein
VLVELNELLLELTANLVEMGEQRTKKEMPHSRNPTKIIIAFSTKSGLLIQ